LQRDFNSDFTGVQEAFGTIRSLSDLTRHLPTFYSVIDEIVEGFVEVFWDRAIASSALLCCKIICLPSKLRTHHFHFHKSDVEYILSSNLHGRCK
jgi:hypothetical protein